MKSNSQNYLNWQCQCADTIRPTGSGLSYSNNVSISTYAWKETSGTAELYTVSDNSNYSAVQGAATVNSVSKLYMDGTGKIDSSLYTKPVSNPGNGNQYQEYNAYEWHCSGYISLEGDSTHNRFRLGDELIYTHGWSYYADVWTQTKPTIRNQAVSAKSYRLVEVAGADYTTLGSAILAAGLVLTSF